MGQKACKTSEGPHPLSLRLALGAEVGEWLNFLPFWPKKTQKEGREQKVSFTSTGGVLCSSGQGEGLTHQLPPEPPVPAAADAAGTAGAGLPALTVLP